MPLNSTLSVTGQTSELGSEPWKNFDKYVTQAESVERVLNPILSLLSIGLNTFLAFYILSKPELRKFTFIIVAFQVSSLTFI